MTSIKDLCSSSLQRESRVFLIHLALPLLKVQISVVHFFQNHSHDEISTSLLRNIHQLIFVSDWLGVTR